ncbi:conserved hypothetical protein [uncultured Paludibacter sp.]|uniref:PD-(D/E)XK nuclease-like domain-containing protein n=1 Tax=uncultured Paludibacter sp. TaxID=497635 RepID=A0A653ADF4_9BACT|nr:conserved hypothetical protein [uncultured Paludibacter sp.]
MAVLFKYRAKVHQSEFKKNALKIIDDGCIPMEVTNKNSLFANTKLVCLPHFLSKNDAQAGKIYCEAYRKTILQCIESEIGGFNAMRDGNMLRSEHIPLNIFVPMREDLEKTKNLLNKFIFASPLKTIEKIIIEKNHDKTIKDSYLPDNKSLDVRIDFINKDEEKGVVGVEVEFTELSFLIREEERNNIFENSEKPYQKVSEFSGYYKTNNIDELITDKLSKDEYRQIWKSHILGASQVKQGKIKHYYNIYLYPNGNEHFSKRIPEYLTFLTQKGKETFIPITYEELFATMESIFNEDKTQINWIKYLKERYLVKN